MIGNGVFISNNNLWCQGSKWELHFNVMVSGQNGRSIANVMEAASKWTLHFVVVMGAPLQKRITLKVERGHRTSSSEFSDHGSCSPNHGVVRISTERGQRCWTVGAKISDHVQLLSDHDQL